jgi:Protein of unknown function (DUF3108)
MKHSKLLHDYAKSLGTVPMKSSQLALILCTLPLLVVALIIMVAISFASQGNIVQSLNAPSGSNADSEGPRPRPTATPLALPAKLAIPRYVRGIEPFSDGQILVYEASWEGIPAGEARISMVHSRMHSGWWTGEMWMTSSALVDKLYRMRDYFREDFAYGSWQPVEINIFQHEKQRKDHWLATFDRPHQLVTAIKTNKAGRTSVRRFSGGYPWGPFSGAMLALSQPLTPGRSYTFDIFSGGNRYVFTFTVKGREQITTGLGVFQALRIEPAVVWLSDSSFRSQAHATTVWVTDDARHLPLRVESAVFIGSVVANLTQVIDKHKSPTP